MYTDKETNIIEKIIKPNLKLIHNMKVKNLKDKYIAQVLGITVREFLQVKDSYEVLNDVYNDAMEILSSELTDIVVGRALGTDGRADKDGKILPPDEKLAFKLLEKFDSRFSVKQEIKQTVTIESIIRRISEKRKAEITNDGSSLIQEVQTVEDEDEFYDEDI